MITGVAAHGVQGEAPADRLGRDAFGGMHMGEIVEINVAAVAATARSASAATPSVAGPRAPQLGHTRE